MPLQRAPANHQGSPPRPVPPLMCNNEPIEWIVLEKKEYNKLLGDVTICIDREKGICIKDVTCPNETCMKMGWVKSVGYPVTCLPNGVYVIITSPDVDKDIILG